MSEKDPFENIQCEHLTDSHLCNIATQKAGFDVGANPTSCEHCLRAKNPQDADNGPICGLIKWRQHEKNSGTTIGDGKLRRRHGAGKKSALAAHGPGTELSKLLPQQLERNGCACKAYANKMNRWGVKECKRRFDEIVDYLVHKGNINPLLGWIPSFATRPVAKKLLTIAINRAEKTTTPSKFTWFSAITTSPRPDCTLQKCVDSMIIAGFDPVIFAEPGSTRVPSCTTVHNDKKKGVWYNWLQSCEYALEHSDANVIMTVQDDSLFHPDSKTFAEKILWPQEDCGFVSLYTPKHYSIVPHFKTKERDVGVNRVYTRSLWGACALVWPREVLQAVIEHKTTKTWLGAPTKSRSKSVMDKRRADPTLVQNSDTALGKIMNQMKRSMFFVDPSPVEHIAEYSVIGHGDNKGRRNCMRCAKWSAPLEDQVPINFEPIDIVI